MFENKDINENFENADFPESFEIHDIDFDDVDVLSKEDETREVVRKTKHYKTVSISDETNNPFIVNVVKNHNAVAENLISLKTLAGKGLVFEFSDPVDRCETTLTKVYSILNENIPAMIGPENEQEKTIEKAKKFINETSEFLDFLS